MHIAFAVMPWHSVDYPCLASGILDALARTRKPHWKVDQIYANLRWGAYVDKATDGRFALDDYTLLSEDFVNSLAGEWVFSSALHGVPEWRVREYRGIFTGTDEQFGKLLLAHRHALAFVEELSAQIVESGVQVLALSSTFTQNAACLALAAAVKRKNPATVTMMGGGNCDGSQGAALHRNYGCLDYVVRGEGETAFAMLLDAIESGAKDLSGIPSLCWRHEGRCVANRSGPVENIDDVPMPHYDPYFEEISRPDIRPHVRPSLVVENARGCWWGEKHHCTFCGLNGSSMKFRSKSEDKALREIEALAQRHRTLDVVVTDNILDMDYFKRFLPALRDGGWDLRLQYEIKANLKGSQIQAMKDAGITHVQPGIESLSSKVLRLMRKGITGARNVQTMRDCEEANLTLSWNYLLGFPGETDDDYEGIIRQIPNLYHLQPPRGGATRVSIQRFSPFFDDPSLGFSGRRPHAAYGLVYGLATDQIEDLAFFFESGHRGVDTAMERKLQRAIDGWTEAYTRGSQLWHVDRGESIEITDERAGRTPRQFTLRDPVEREVHRTLRGAMNLSAVRNSVNAKLRAAEPEVDRVVEGFRDDGLVFEDAGQYVVLSTPSIPFRSRYH